MQHLEVSGAVRHIYIYIYKYIYIYVVRQLKVNVYCIYLRRNSDLCHLHHKLIGFYNRVEKCLLRGTN